MRKLMLGVALIGSIGFIGAASPAFAGPGQCFDAYGRRVGPVYDTDRPNYGFINSVIRRGGSCTGVVTPPSRPRYNYYGPGYRPDYYRPGYRNDGSPTYDGYRRYDDGYSSPWQYREPTR